ncbi:SDR family oxidoreductase [Spiractinospora alimapuensis]|uniref:SDR family oxidoreductase n=1 Tax=Spiractinospora alimapuensis TaxID=2820884 RepID=UPI001F3DD7AA|nr:SDR family oxidoreductase [Spiractinospora alimapuensis]QVQ52280.1 SDR family oxidoreductase [Spiractinospora alimapuensis]
MNVLDSFSLSGRRVLLTGGSRGLGHTMAVGLVQAGARVVTVSRSGGDGADGVVTMVGDVTRLDTLESLVDEAEGRAGGTIDSVVHAAGVQHRAPAVDFPLPEWERVVRTNLTAPFALSQEVGRRQIERGIEGSHVFVGSLTSTLARPNLAAYAASKSGLLGVVRTLAAEWATSGVRVNALGPGYYRTALTEELFRDDAAREELMGRIPQGRFGRPEDLCGPLVFLTSAASSYMTGQLVMVDGGWTAM